MEVGLGNWYQKGGRGAGQRGWAWGTGARRWVVVEVGDKGQKGVGAGVEV